MSSPGEESERRMSNEREETEIENQSPSSQPLASPSKVPASLSAKTKDELAELLVSTLRQLKARDQRLKELNELSKARDAEREERLEREKREELARQQGEERRQKEEERYMAELAALKEKHGALQKQHEDLVRQRAEEAQQQRASSEEELSTLRKSQAKLKKAVVELKKRNESLDVRHKEAEVARCTMADELSKAEAQIAAFSEYKQKAHALLKAKDEEIRNGTEAIREAFEAELGMEKAARREAEVARDAAVEELGTVQSQVAAQIRDLELQHEDQLAQLKKELELQATHAKNSAKRLQQLQVRFDSAQQRYESLKNSKMNGAEKWGEGGQSEHTNSRVGVDAESNARLEEALHALEKAQAEASATAQINSVLEQEVASLKATVNQLKMTLMMKKSIKTPFYDHVGDRMPPSPFSPAADAADNVGEVPGQGARVEGAATSTSLKEKLSMAERKASNAEKEVDDLELEIKLRETQEKALKSTIRELEGEIHRLKLASHNDGVDMEYLKNILVQVFKGAQDELSLLQVVAKILGLTPDEFKECAKAIKARKTQADAGYLPDLSSLIPTSFMSSQ